MAIALTNLTEATVQMAVLLNATTAVSEQLPDFLSNSSTTDMVGEQSLKLVLAPVFLLVGVAGNCLSGAVMLRRQFRRMSLGIYLCLLALFDNATLLSNRLTRDWIKLVFGVNLRTYSNGSCLASVYIMYSASCVSSWLIVAVSVERTLVVCQPFRSKQLSTRGRAACVATSIVLFLLLVHGFIFKIVRLQTVPGLNNQIECMFIPESEFGGIKPNLVLELFHLFMYSLIPAIILFSSNIIIIINLARSLKFRNSFSKDQRSPSMSHGNSTINRTTWMLIVMSTTFIILTLPLSLLLLHSAITGEHPDKKEEIVLFCMKCVNHAINFLLYSVSGPAFRKELHDMCCKRDESIVTMTEDHNSKYVVCKSIPDRSQIHHV